METQNTRSVIIQDSGNDLLIVIPNRRNWLGIVFTIAWLFVWLIGELKVLASPLDNFDSLCWLLIWTAGGLFVLRSLIWNLSGKELIAIDQQTLIVEKKGLLFSKPMEFDTSAIRNLRVEQDTGGYAGRFVVQKHLLNTGSDGIIRFDYRSKTVKFGGSIGNADAAAILQKMKERQYLKESHFIA